MNKIFGLLIVLITILSISACANSNAGSIVAPNSTSKNGQDIQEPSKQEPLVSESPKQVQPMQESPKQVQPTQEPPKQVQPTQEPPKQVQSTEESPKPVQATLEPPKQEVNKYNTQNGDQTFFGIWTVSKQVASCKVSAASEDDIKKYIGKTVTYSLDSVNFEGNILNNAYYKINTISDSDFFDNCYTSSESVGIKGKSLSEVQIYTDKEAKKPWNNFGNDFYIKDQDTLVLLTNKGVYYELNRVK